MSLVEKMRKAREVRVPVGDKAFIIRRPTALEMIELRQSAQARGRAVLPFVVGWENVTSLDLMPGGDAGPVAFDAGVAAEWLTDRLDLLQPVADAVFKAYQDHEDKLEAAKKN